MSMKSFEEIAIGETSKLHRRILQSDVDRFVGLTGDDNPLHVDAEFASRTSFKEPVVHGMLAGSLVSTLIGTQLPGPGALWVRQEFRFLGPVRVGDDLTVSAVVIAKHDRERTIDIDIEVLVSGRGPVLRGKGTVMVLDLDAEGDQPTPVKPIRRALVTGATGAIGGATARALSADGFHVIVHSNSGQKRALLLQEELIQAGGACDVFQCDLSNIDRTKKFANDLIGRFGTIDTLILNASAPIEDADLLNTSASTINDSLAVNLHSSLALVQQFVPGMMKQEWGRIVGVSSDAAHVQPTRGWFSYISGKVALEALIRQSAIEFGPRGITSNVVAPGMTDTNFISNLSARSRQVVAQTTPNRRLASANDIASAISYLCQTNSSHINGQTLRINGGIGI
jgi:3-oxoacyl-[acyl-carrier protein] reductase